jgi:hypothetical protein
LVFGSRRLHQATVLTDDDAVAAGFGTRGRAIMLPLVLGNGRVLKRVPPTLSPQERSQIGH